MEYDKTLYDFFRNALKEYRKSHRITQVQVGTAIGKSSSYIADIECGFRIIDYPKMSAITEIFNLTVEDFIYINDMKIREEIEINDFKN
ncbi:MAG: helix-turn-helix transcriptional regulator [Clostridiaceae bacterium]|nr:helix-turn-helix transcriptional regulator [Clostridiaceae bacterium]